MAHTYWNTNSSIYSSYETKRLMYFAELSFRNKILYTKREFITLAKATFDNPEILKGFVNEKKISNDQSKIIVKFIHKLNSKTCVCCRKFDQSKLQLTPVEIELEPLLEIAQGNVKSRTY